MTQPDTSISAPAGKQDWDWVSMEDYDKDIKDLVDTSAAIIANQKHEIDRLKYLLALVVHSAGRVEIPNHYFLAPEKIILERSENFANDTTVFRSVKSND